MYTVTASNAEPVSHGYHLRTWIFTAAQFNHIAFPSTLSSKKFENSPTILSNCVLSKADTSDANTNSQFTILHTRIYNILSPIIFLTVHFRIQKFVRACKTVTKHSRNTKHRLIDACLKNLVWKAKIAMIATAACTSCSQSTFLWLKNLGTWVSLKNIEKLILTQWLSVTTLKRRCLDCCHKSHFWPSRSQT